MMIPVIWSDPVSDFCRIFGVRTRWLLHTGGSVQNTIMAKEVFTACVCVE